MALWRVQSKVFKKAPDVVVATVVTSAATRSNKRRGIAQSIATIKDQSR